MRVLAHDEVGVERDRLTGCRQVVESAHGHVDFVAHAADADQHRRRMLGGEPPSQPADQTSLPFFIRRSSVANAPSRPPCAWQVAEASAGAASAIGPPSSGSRRLTMCCTCSFFAWPWPTTACLTCGAVFPAT